MLAEKLDIVFTLEGWMMPLMEMLRVWAGMEVVDALRDEIVRIWEEVIETVGVAVIDVPAMVTAISLVVVESDSY